MKHNIKEIVERFRDNEWKHWHTKSSSFDRLPDSTKDEMVKEIIQSHINMLDDLVEEIRKERKKCAFQFGDDVQLDTFDLVITHLQKRKEELKELIK